MYNLLPEEQQKILRGEYRLRVATVTMFLLSGIFVCGFLSLVPAITLTYIKQSSFQEELDLIKQGKEENAGNSYTNVIQVINDQVKILSIVDQEHVPHKVFDSIVISRGGSIKITKFTYEVVGTSTAVTLEGAASRLDQLLKFQETLLKTNFFSKADFPIELLAKPKNSEVRFTMQLK
ncbi:MAG: hypothetical protein AAB513_02110 [Patescibacteria group bacterium]